MDAISISTAILSCIILIFNLTGNSFVIHLITKKHTTCTDVLLLNLAISDLFFGMFIVPVQIILNVMSPFELYHSKNIVLCKLVGHGNVAWLTTTVSVLTMMVLSVERYFAVCRPHNFKRWFTKRNAVIIALVIWIASIGAAVPLVIDENCWPFDENEGKIHSIWLLSFTFGNQVFLGVLSVKITFSLWCKQRSIQPTALREIEERKKKKKVTMCVLAVIATYIVCYIPHCILYVMQVYGNSQSEQKRFVQITMMFLAINAALDPYLFGFQNPRMKTLLKKILLCKDASQEQQALPSLATDNLNQSSQLP